MSQEIYQKLRKQIDQYSVGFPEAPSGVDIKILERLYTVDEALIYLDMSLKLENVQDFCQRTQRDVDTTDNMLETMAQNGLLFRKRKPDANYYAAIPFVIGSFEFQLNRMDKEFAELVEKYFEEVYLDSFSSAIPPLRTIPVNQSIGVAHKVASYADAKEIIKSKSKIAVANCICRTQQNLLEDGCGKPLEVCLMFGSHADYYIENKMARPIDRKEALSILDTCEEAGLVNQPANMVNPGGMCNCCGDCCGVLRALNRHPTPSKLVCNDYTAECDSDQCTGCELCLERCQMGAIEISDDQTARIQSHRCIGCGLCVTTCPGEALSLILKPEDQRTPPPQNGMELMQKTAEIRGTSLIPFSMS